MKMNKLALAVIIAGTTAVAVSGCNGSKHRPSAGQTPVTVFDGYGIRCTIDANGLRGTAGSGVGKYVITDRFALPAGAVVSATGCTDNDTGARLPAFLGAAQTGGAIASPFTTLIVAHVRNLGGDPANLSQDALNSAAATIRTNLGLPTSYNPLDPATADYVATINTSTPGSAQDDLMRTGLALTTLMKLVASTAPTTGLDEMANAIVDGTLLGDDVPGGGNGVEDFLLELGASASNSANMATIVDLIAEAPTVQDSAGIAKATAAALDTPGSAPATLTQIADETYTPPPVPVGNGSANPPPTGSTGGTGG